MFNKPIYISLYILFIELDKFINIYCSYRNDSQTNSLTLMHGKANAYKSREKYLLSLYAGKRIGIF